MRAIRVWVDQSLCVGNGTCVSIAPRVFRHNEDRQSEVVDPAGESEERVLTAARNCPVCAIHVEAVETGERLFPRGGR
jgi:ferredoxin